LFCIVVAVICSGVVIDGQNIPYSNPNIQYVGRTALTPTGRVFSWPGVTISTQFSGSATLSVYFAGSSSMYFTVFVDGQKSTLAVHPSSTPQAYVVATGLSLGSHVVSLVRRNEANFGPTTFTGFGLAQGGNLQPPPARPDRRIEFIGDSITCGYGDLGVLPCSFSAETEDVYQAHGPITARALKADYYVAAWSGMGMVRNYGDPNTVSAQPFPAIYDYIVGGEPSYKTWNYTNWVPHAIVINLGTNDYSTNPQPPESVYTTAYVKFVNHLKSVYAPSKPAFFLVCGPMSQDYCSYAQSVATTVGGTFVNLWGLNVQPFGCDYHPTVAVQTNMATKETEAIATVLKWTTSSPTILHQ